MDTKYYNTDIVGKIYLFAQWYDRLGVNQLHSGKIFRMLHGRKYILGIVNLILNYSQQICQSKIIRLENAGTI